VRRILPHQSRPENLHPPTPGLYNLHMELKDHPPFELKPAAPIGSTTRNSRPFRRTRPS
jgi:hypothetical protein